MKENELDKYATLGMAAMLPGMVRAVEVLQSQIDEMRRKLGELQGEEAPAPHSKTAKREKCSKAQSGYWASMTPEERSAEMSKRIAKRAANKATHPRDSRHPRHAQWLASMKKSARKRWDGMSVRQQKQRLAKMVAGRANGAAAEAIQ